MHEPQLYSNIRTAISRYNVKHGTNYTAHLEDDKLVIQQPSKEDRPTKAEFAFWLGTLVANQVHVLGPQYQAKFGLLIEWIAEFNKEMDCEIVGTVENGQLTITS